jgi:monoterpene epsilon-lactone hydrolase
MMQNLARRSRFGAAALALSLTGAIAQAAPVATFAPDGTAHVVDLSVPIPRTISTQAQAMLRANAAAGDHTHGLTIPLQQMRAANDARLQATTRQLLQMYGVKVERKVLAGVPVALVTPLQARADRKDRLLINVHGGAFFLGKGSITEAIPIAARTGIAVLAVDYRLAPETPFPGAVDDTIAVYRELLKTYSPKHLALYGSSAGAVLSAQTAVRARQLGLPLPAALGFFSGTVDFARPADSEAFFTLGGLGPLVTPVAVQARGYLADNNLTDPVMSPAYADVKGFPPVLLMCGTRDFFLSGTTNFHRQLLRAGVPAQLVVFDAMPHVHWDNPALPESQEALDIQARFLAEQVSGS